MNQFRLVILDNAKQQLENETVKKVLSDMIFAKQKNFERTDPNYIVLDKHDMIGTHFLVYNTENMFNPQLIFAIRVTYENRAKQHKLKLPMQDLVPHLDEGCKDLYANFRNKFDNLADCNSWFVDPNFSFKSSGLKVSDLGYLMVFLHLKRMGIDHFIGCSNEKYKAHRWVDKIGEFKKGHVFIHPVVPDPHMMVMVDRFKIDNLKEIYSEYSELFNQITDLSLFGSDRFSIKKTADLLFANLTGSDLIESGAASKAS